MNSANGTDQWNETLPLCILNLQMHLVPYLRWLVPVLTVAGVIGNGLILIIFDSRGMRSKTNFILSAMAVADLAHAVIAMLTNLYLYESMIDSDSFSRFYHHRMKPALMTLVNWSAMTSTWLAVAVTAERFIAIRYPFEARLILRKRRIVFATAAIAVISLLVCSYYAFWLRPVAGVSCRDRGRTLYRLIPDPRLSLYGHTARQVHSLLCSVAPIALLFYFNCSLVYHLRRNRDSTAAAARRMRRSVSQEKRSNCSLDDTPEHKVALIVLAITLTAACLLSPSAAIVIYDAVRYAASAVSGRTAATPWWYAPASDLSNTLVLIQKVLDFYLYCFTSSTFRRRLMAILCSPGPTALANQRRRSSILRRYRSQVIDPVGLQSTVHYYRVVDDGSSKNIQADDGPAFSEAGSTCSSNAAGKRCGMRPTSTSTQTGCYRGESIDRL